MNDKYEKVRLVLFFANVIHFDFFERDFKLLKVRARDLQTLRRSYVLYLIQQTNLPRKREKG